MKHLKDNSKNNLETILDKLTKNHISYSIRHKDGKIIELKTQNKELLDFAKKNNPNLK